ncbi:MAG: aminotransferase class I/II-fold pyridoxal phosphate-dependent enzyme [Pseudomonadota bacterium]
MPTPTKKPSYVVRPDTAVLTRGFDPRLSVGSVRPAVFRSSTYVFRTPESAERAFQIALGKVKPEAGEDVDLIYSRLSHPNSEIFEDQVVPLEPEAQKAAVFNTGMAAISTAFLTYCPPGSSFVYTNPVYGGTHHLIHQILIPLGIHALPVAAGDTQGLRTAIRKTKNLRMVFVETPANPTLTMSDIDAAVEEARKHAEHPLVAVDNTFMGPAFQHPIKLGADLSIYSATKYLSGYSDMTGGVILAKNPELIAQLQGTRAVLGNILQPDECWMLSSRLPMVNHRMNRQSKNAQRIAESLQGHPKIGTIHYPSLFTDPEQIRIRDAQCDFPGALISIDLKGGKRAAFETLRALEIFKNAVSLGGVESLVCHPGTTTHSEMTPEGLVAAGITDGLIRFSIGVEAWEDLLQDIQQAMNFSDL